MDSIIEVNGEKYRVDIQRYASNGNTAVALHNMDPEQGYIKLSVNTPRSLPQGFFAVKTYSENSAIWEEAFASGLFEATGESIDSGFVTLPIWRIK